MLFFILSVWIVVFLSGTLVKMSQLGREPESGEWQECFRALSVNPDYLEGAADWNEKTYRQFAASFLYTAEEGGYRRLKRTERLFCAFFLPKNTVKKYATAFHTLLSDGRYFPVGVDAAGEYTVSYEDSWGGTRTYGGKRCHEGTDIMPSQNKSGLFPIISVSDGVVEKKGWLTLGGYRIGIRSDQGAYYYYAHLNRYADGIAEGKKVCAGETIGYMGDSGYGEEGTVGQFAVHLHFGIYLDMEGTEVSVNPYSILKYLEKNKKILPSF